MKKEKQSKNWRNRLIIFPRVVISIFILIIVLALPIIIISGSESFYKNRLEKSNCYEMISAHDCIDLSMNALNFLKGKETLDARYSAREQSHFQDVKLILDFAKALVAVLFVFVLAYFVLFFVIDKTEMFKTLKLAGWMIIIFFALMLIAITISFNGTFFLFHALLFPQGNWTFPFDFTILTVFPESFFVHAAFTSFLFSLGAGAIILGFGLKKKNNKMTKINKI
ncbi:MAG: DUF1461 domain-containing protein [Candidatus Nanoarchaeia archaeon]